jgi:MFS family permease
MIVAGVGAGLVNIPLASTAVAVVEPARAGMASGVNSTFRQVGVATGIAVLGAIFSHSIGDTRSPQAFVDGLNSILLVGAGVAFFAALAAFALIRQRDYVVAVADSSSSTTTSGGANSRTGKPLVPSPEVT